MPLLTRRKNAHQRPGLILLADTKKRRTKQEVAADTERKRVDEETTRVALHNLRQFIADEEDMLAEDEAAESMTILPPSQRPPPLARQNAITILDSDSEHNGDMETQDKGESDGSVSDIDEDPDSGGYSDDDVEDEKTKKEQRRETRNAIQVLRKQAIDEEANDASKTRVAADKTNETGGNGKPSGPLRVKTWAAALANQRATTGRAAKKAQERMAKEANDPAFQEARNARDRAIRESIERVVAKERSLAFGPSTKKGLSVTGPRSRAASMSPSVVLTPSTPLGSGSQGSLAKPNVALCGLEDENDDLNEIGSVLGKRGSSTLAVKIEDADMPPKKRGGRGEGSKRQTRFTNCDLPRGTHDSNDWRGKFIPTYEKWLGTRGEPWIVDENENVAALQTIWSAVYPHIDHMIDINGPVYYIATQRAAEWRSMFGSTAIALFKAAFENETFLGEERISTATELLQNSAFLYADSAGETQKEYSGLLRSPWILQLFAAHYDRISGAIRIPEFEPSFSQDELTHISALESELNTLDTDSSDALKIAVEIETMRIHPKGALAICAVAVERALNVFVKSSNDTTSATFSRKWNSQVQKYCKIIDQKLRAGSMEDIILRSCAFMKRRTVVFSFNVGPCNLDEDDTDDIEMFVDA